MPKINTHYFSGPIDEKVLRAADEIGLPDVVVSFFDGVDFEWRWNLSGPGEEGVLREVVLLLCSARPGEVSTSVHVVRTPVGEGASWQLVGHSDAANPAEVADSWLVDSLRQAVVSTVGAKDRAA
ncbi:MAG TPA: hypothetical protein VGK54_03025 [Chloroflexota bacterium]